MPEPVITTARSPRHDLPYLFPAQAQKEAFVNEALARLDALVQTVVDGERDGPPTSPERGDCFIVGEGASGAWSGHTGAIAIWAEGQWLFTPAFEGMQAYDLDSASVATYRADSGWRRLAVPALPSGGAVQDIEARAAIAALAASLRSLGIFA